MVFKSNFKNNYVSDGNMNCVITSSINEYFIKTKPPEFLECSTINQCSLLLNFYFAVSFTIYCCCAEVILVWLYLKDVSSDVVFCSYQTVGLFQ